MNPAAQTLLQRIRRDGQVTGEIIKVDQFLNHMVDPQLIDLLAADIATRFIGQKIDKVITAETSGIILAQPVAGMLGVPYVFAKKKQPLTMVDCYFADSFSFTKQETTRLHVSKDVLSAGERILFIDDFFAKGATLLAIEDILTQANAILIGTAVIINKSARRDIESILTLADLRTN
ncbi:phosphoribosyltransferase family protein [Geopsychrobacter electrodiphilus]|uniref:phosphoribosyltransferase family protein n=1 Tax=Geopsychrobacter electrodiphilus TaxID=225196 RepID=UPI00037EB2A8|nr:phosphoribosyltransferase family protein [Geopsychrobacter electrodiphilus]